MTINEVTNYLNKMLREYLTIKEMRKNFKIIYGAEPSQNFLALLETAKDIKVAELHTSKIYLGSEAMDVVQEEDNSMKEEIIITVKAQPKESLKKRVFRRIFRELTSVESKVSRIRLYGHDENSNLLKIDSQPLKKVDYVTAELEQNGTIKTESIFEKMYVVLGVIEEAQ
ncbi:hypothetical protein N6H13_12740 [Paenibacillus sp. CC-CFT742]|nr:hypothetical protein [Paenibacillus sp. CC-CFT742]WJH31336.1 hypothetical protein N6H13_12740 [Paenibacillus sp. CC-CFT742]